MHGAVKRPSLLKTVERALVKSVWRWQRALSRQLGAEGRQVGAAVAMTQWFGSSLQLTPHLHVLVPEAVWSAMVQRRTLRAPPLVSFRLAHPPRESAACATRSRLMFFLLSRLLRLGRRMADLANTLVAAERATSAPSPARPWLLLKPKRSPTGRVSDP